MVVRFIHSGCLPKGLDNITHLHDLCYSKINTDVDFMVRLINQQVDLRNTVRWAGIVSITHIAKLNRAKSENFNNEIWNILSTTRGIYILNE